MKPSGKGEQNSRLQASLTKTTVENINKSTAMMKNEINAETRLSALTNAQTGSKIAKLQEKGTYYAKQIEVEAKKLHDLEGQIELVQRSINEKRDKLRQVEGNTSDSLGKKIKQYERQLDKTLQKHNEILAENRQLKEEIDHLRRERVTFDKIYKKLEVELRERINDLQSVADKSETAKKKKAEIEKKIEDLKVRVKKEENNMEREFQDVFRDINEKNVVDRIEEKFGTVKDRVNVLKGKDLSPAKHNMTNMSGDESPDHDDFLRNSPRKTAKSIDKRKQESFGKTPQEEVEEYNAIFENLKKKTHKNDLKEILALFEDYENKNYSLYQHLSHLSDEKEGLEKQIQEIKQEIGKLTQNQQKENNDDGSDNKAQKIHELKRDIEASDNRFKFLETKQGELTEIINSLKISIPIIFERIGCNIEDYANELIDGTTVNEGNMLQYLAIIEKKTNEILQMYHFSNKDRDNVNKPLDERNKRANEESSISGSTQFPEKELVGDLIKENQEKQDQQSPDEFLAYAEEKIKAFNAAKKGTKK